MQLAFRGSCQGTMEAAQLVVCAVQAEMVEEGKTVVRVCGANCRPRKDHCG